MRLWGGVDSPGKAREQVDALWQRCGLSEGDQSADLLAAAESARGQVGDLGERLVYRRHDLRQPLAESGFDAARNIFSSIGYGTDEEDAAILATLRDSVRPGGRVFVDTMHRDALAADLRPGEPRGYRLADGTLLIEESSFDPIAGRAESTWTWSGPSGAGAKHASLRIYCITELVHMMMRAGLRLVSAHAGCSTERFDVTAPRMGGRVGLLAVRE